MAKRRKSEKEELEEIFKEPEFDEREYLISEIKKGKGIILVFIIATAIGFISGFFQVWGDALAAVFLGFILLFSLKYILSIVNAEFSDKKTWAFAIIAFLLIWFTCWTVALNPPFNDISPPQIRSISVEYNNTWIVVYEYGKGLIQSNIDKVKWSQVNTVRALVTDNSEVQTVKINKENADKNGDYWEARNLDLVGRITVEAWDTHGNYARKEITVPTGI